MSDREMTIADSSKQPPHCNKCGMQKMHVDNKWQCINCGTDEPKTGHTVILVEPNGAEGPLKIERVMRDENGAVLHGQPVFTPAQVEAEFQRRTNTVLLHVPTSLFPDLVMWARKLKLPKDWKEAEKIKAITDFQVEINKKLEGLSQ